MASFQDMLGNEYEIRLSGGMLGYLLKVLSDLQIELSRETERDITDSMAAMLAATNSVVGDALLREVYQACGASFLAHAMNTDEASIRNLMESQTPDEVKEAAKSMSDGLKKKLN